MVACVELSSFIKHIARQSLLFGEKFYRKRRIELNCRLFIRRLKNKTRKKMLFVTKAKLSIKLAATLSVRMVMDRC